VVRYEVDEIREDVDALEERGYLFPGLHERNHIHSDSAVLIIYCYITFVAYMFSLGD
jgi:hypothetical protein